MMNSKGASSKFLYKPDKRFFDNIDAWMADFFPGPTFSYSYQYVPVNGGTLAYNPDRTGTSITKEKLIEHFYHDPIQEKNRFRGSLAMISTFQEKVKWICFDLDNETIVAKAKTLLSKLDELKIEYLTEYGGDKLERRHIWIKVHAKQSIAREFFTRLLMQVYGYKTDIEPFVDGEFDEVFGVNKPRNLIRIPIGYHLKRKKRFPIELKDGSLSTDPADFIETWLSLSVLTESRMAEISKDFPDIEVKKPRTSSLMKEKFYYIPRRLKPLLSTIPPFVAPAFNNCQAMHGVLEDIINEKMIELPGEVHHSAGLYMAGVFAYNDVYKSKSTRRKVIDGYKLFKSIERDFRFRDPTSHSWESSWKTAEHSPDRVFPSCKAWEEKFNKCEGCPFKDIVTTPKQFIFGEKVERQIVQHVNLTTVDKIRNTTFQTVKNHIDNLCSAGRSEDILLASPQGSGKSTLVDEIACEQAKKGKKILIAVPTTQLAIEHKQRLTQCGVRSFILSSHKSIFEKQIANFACPNFDQMQDLFNLGATSECIKKTHCKTCPFLDDCPYPSQYKKVQDQKYQIVIIQHAHFSTPEIIYELMNKRFDILFIDESFVQNCYENIPVIQEEIDLLNTFNYAWCSYLADWLSGNSKTLVKLDPDVYELTDVHLSFKQFKLQWRIPDLIRFYNQNKEVDEFLGIKIIHEIPKIPVRVFTDATPPEELIKHAAGVSTLKVFGRDEILDPRLVHPENEVIQVLDNSTSVNALSNTVKFELIMMKVAELVELVYTNHKVLLTAYKKDFDRIEKFFEDHKVEFPTARSRITLDRMDKGTNKYEDYDVQFLMAGVYATPNQLKLEAYKYKEMFNFYSAKRGQERINNVFPESLSKAGSMIQEASAVQRIEPIGNGGAIVEYPTLKKLIPQDTWCRYVFNMNIANTQQSVRLRFKSDKPRVVYILNNLFFPSLLITKSLMIEEFVRPV